MGRFFIQKSFAQSALEIWVINDLQNGDVEILHGNGEVVTVKRHEASPAAGPSIVIPRGWFAGADVMNVLAEAIKEAGGKAPDHSKTEGQLEATRYHLEDLRSLLKLDEKIRPGEKK